MNWGKEKHVQYSQHNRTFLCDVGVYVEDNLVCG